MEEKVKRLVINYINTKRSWDAWLYMSWTGPIDSKTGLPNIDSSPKNLVDQNDLLTYLKYLAWKDFHIEITKIVKEENNPDGIYNLLKEFGAKNPERKNDIAQNLKELNGLKDEIENIIRRRNKVYAHLDRHHELHGGLGEITPYEKLFETVERGMETLTSKAELERIKNGQPLYFFTFSTDL